MCTYPLDVLEAIHLAHEMLLNLQLNLAGNLERRCQEHIQRMIDRALGRVFDRNYAKVGRAALHFLEILRQWCETAAPGLNVRTVCRRQSG